MVSFRTTGFTLVELIIAISVLAILSVLSIVTYNGIINNNYLKSATADVESIANATKLYAAHYDNYPPDVSRDIPAEVKQFMDSQDDIDDWPNAPWPSSVFDYDHWTINGVDTVQISVRFCPAGGPLSACKFPKESWASGFGVNSAFYYCIKGNCRSHSAEAATYPGYCVNCPNHTAVGT
ncbi:MAG TPA: type II secretion system protein [Candidatus Saccharimonadales bacterium]